MSAPTQEATHTRLNLEDLRNFDAEATKLILEMQVAGWTGYITNRGHAFMKSPDGVTTASVTRDSLRGRSGRNARAQLTRWLRVQREAAESKPGRSFGEVAFNEPGIPAWGNRVLPVATLAELKRSTAFNEFMDQTRGMDGADVMAFVGCRDADDNPRQWAAFDIRHKANPVLLATGSQMTEDQAWEQVYDQHPRLRIASTTSATHTPEDQAMKVFVCKTCAEQFEVLTDLASHVNNTHPNSSWQCDQCEKVFNTAGGLNLHKSASHPIPVKCPECDRELMGAGALGVHRRKAHGVLKKSLRDKAAREAAANEGVVVTHTEPHEPVVHEPILVRTSIIPDSVTDDIDTVTSPDLPTEPTGDVLMDYLLSSPEGEDAEDIVAKMRALLAAPIVRELRKLREENTMLREQNDKLSHDNGDLEAKLSIMREALAV